jgi:hypothetical protein
MSNKKRITNHGSGESGGFATSVFLRRSNSMTVKPCRASGQTHWRGYHSVSGPLKAAFILIVIAATFWAGGRVWADEKGPAERASEAAAKAPRYRAISLKHIPAQKGKDFLSGLGIGTVSELPGANMLLVTGQPRELAKAGAILGLVDAREEFAVKTIVPSWSAQDYPLADSRIAELGGILVGTFANPPVSLRSVTLTGLCRLSERPHCSKAKCLPRRLNLP